MRDTGLRKEGSRRKRGAERARHKSLQAAGFLVKKMASSSGMLKEVASTLIVSCWIKCAVKDGA